MIYKFTIYGRLDGLNEYTKANRTNPYAGASMKKKNENKVINALEYARLLHVTIANPVLITFKWYEENRRRDMDNIAFAKKFILDALVGAKLLKNDSWDYVEGFTDHFEIDKENPRIEVIIYES